MRYQVLASVLLLVCSGLSAPADGNDDDCNVGPNQKNGIQYAIDNAKRGSTITVEAGTYAEQLTITKDNIKLVAKGKVILIPPPKLQQNTCTGLNKDFEGKDTDAGICISGSNIEFIPYVKEHKKVKSVGRFIRNVAVTGFEVRNFTGENIAVVGGQDTRITNNVLVDGPQYGFLSVGSKGTVAEGNIIKSSAPPLYFIAMCMDDYADAKFRGNDLSSYTIGLCTQTSGGVMKDNTVHNCCIGNFVDPGIKDARIISNTITDRNPFCDNIPESPAAGIIISGAVGTVVKHNIIKNMHNNITKAVGIFVTDDEKTGLVATGNVVKHNTLESNDFDVFVASNGADNVLKNNQCDPMKVAPGAYCN